MNSIAAPYKDLERFLRTLEYLALSQRLSPLGLIFRSPTPTSGKIILVNFRISLLKHIKLINYYSRHYALS
jgi:hypothetical protein